MMGIRLDEWLAFIAGSYPVDERLAKGLALLFGTSTEVWLRLQRAYDRNAHIDGRIAGGDDA